MRYKANGYRHVGSDLPLTPPDDSVPTCVDCKNDLTSEEIEACRDRGTSECAWCYDQCVECGGGCDDSWHAHARALGKTGPMCGECVAEERQNPKAAVLLAGLP